MPWCYPDYDPELEPGQYRSARRRFRSPRVLGRPPRDGRGITRREDLLGEDQLWQFFRVGRRPIVQRIIAFWSEVDESLKF